MRTATITETKNHLSALIHEVRRGETIIVMDRNKPVARIESVEPLSDESHIARIERLQRDGILCARRENRMDKVLTCRPVTTMGARSAVKVLVEEREAGR